MKTNLYSILTGCFVIVTAGSGLVTTAHAQCSSMSQRGAVAWQNESWPSPPTQPLAAPDRVQALAKSDASIVGLWRTTFILSGQVVDQAFETFHGDGTEMMVDTAPPSSDNVCVGVWAKSDGLSVKLNHPSWTFDDKGNLNGTAAIKMDLKLDPNGNTFSGTFTVDVFDLAGNTVQHLAGTVAGKRIEVD